MCSKILSSGGHAEHNGYPYCHKPCYTVLFGPKGVNIGGVKSYIYDTTPRASEDQGPMTLVVSSANNAAKPATRVVAPARTFAGETPLCPGCGKVVYFAEKHRPCLRCQCCNKTLTSGGHAAHDGLPYCHVPCYGHLFGPKGMNIGDVGCYI
ncbi:hypothetical protein AB205_0041180 [Aquarana catesbeiana]|uniref:LIM zinc-binding domain-containing protein n=1 Tax=Aquarana catesbeiana TaxID=8400 RepID=A0A2G9Q107_AQUCT|nr:hypothetical protein AB205_0041180 [Aquarana catesbeiana]